MLACRQSRELQANLCGTARNSAAQRSENDVLPDKKRQRLISMQTANLQKSPQGPQL